MSACPSEPGADVSARPSEPDGSGIDLTQFSFTPPVPGEYSVSVHVAGSDLSTGDASLIVTVDCGTTGVEPLSTADSEAWRGGPRPGASMPDAPIASRSGEPIRTAGSSSDSSPCRIFRWKSKTWSIHSNSVCRSASGVPRRIEIACSGTTIGITTSASGLKCRRVRFIATSSVWPTMRGASASR